jgi:hypothetical protein
MSPVRRPAVADTTVERPGIVEESLMPQRVIPPQQAELLIRRLREVARRESQVRADLEDFPRVRDRLCSLWGYREARRYLEELLLVDPDRVSREGFPEELEQELAFLYQLLVDQRHLLLRPGEDITIPPVSSLYSFDR